jgi:hypothetical protein
MAAAGFTWGFPLCPRAPSSGGWKLRLADLGGAASPIMLQLNVPAHAMTGYTHHFVVQFPPWYGADN